MVVDVSLRYSVDFCRLLLEFMGWSGKDRFASAEEAQFASFAAGLVQNTLSSESFGFGARSEGENAGVWCFAKDILALLSAHSGHAREFGKSLGVHEAALMFRLFVLVPLQSGLEGFDVLVETDCVRFEKFAVDFEPVGWVLGLDDLALSLGNISFDKVDPEFFIVANDLGRVLFDLSL